MLQIRGIWGLTDTITVDVASENKIFTSISTVKS